MMGNDIIKYVEDLYSFHVPYKLIILNRGTTQFNTERGMIELQEFLWRDNTGNYLSAHAGGRDYGYGEAILVIDFGEFLNYTVSIENLIIKILKNVELRSLTIGELYNRMYIDDKLKYEFRYEILRSLNCGILSMDFLGNVRLIDGKLL